MADVRINIFDSYSLFHSGNTFTGANSLSLLGLVIPGSISFNNIAIIKSIDNSVHTFSALFGLYSLNGSTLSLANSASNSHTATGRNWMSLVTSATQDISPGNWYFGLIMQTSSNAARIFKGYEGQAYPGIAAYAGIFVRGIYSVSTNALPSSINTTDMTKELNTANITFPYILISA